MVSNGKLIAEEPAKESDTNFVIVVLNAFDCKVEFRSANIRVDLGTTPQLREQEISFAGGKQDVDYATDSSAIEATNSYVFPYLQPVRRGFLAAHLSQVGFPDDNLWLSQLGRLPAENSTVNGAGDEVTDPVHSPWAIFTRFYGLSFFGDLNSTPQSAQNDYTYRWRLLGGNQNQGGWFGYFTGNLTSTTIYNTFNKSDCALDNAFYIKQLVQSPDRSFADSISALNFAMLNTANPFPVSLGVDNDSSQSWLFQPPSSPALYGDEETYLRWARLAYWYPSRTSAIGAYSFTNVFNSNVVDLTSYAGLTDPSGNAVSCSSNAMYTPASLATMGVGTDPLGNDLSSHLETHDYLRADLFPSMWPVFKKIRGLLYSIPDPDPPPVKGTAGK
jgi:hypothetical protein